MQPMVTLDELLSFIHAHTLTKRSSEDSLNDVLVDDPAAFCTLVCGSGYYVQNVIWWERALIETGSALGFGGPQDPRDPRHFYSETPLDDKFSPDTPLEYYLRYMNATREAHPKLSLHPGFDLSLREEKTQN